jgi:lysozyme family protein
MTIGRSDLADTLELLARLCRAPEPESAPPAAPSGVDPPAVKDALLAVSQGGVRFLQEALGGIGVDGDVGPETRGALAAAELGALLKAIELKAAGDLPSPPSTSPKSGLTDELREEYKSLFAAAQTRPEHARQVASITSRVQAAEVMPEVVAVSATTGVPARIICIMQALEANLDFRCHLHNGDPLRARTVNVPAGRPPQGQPPFSWSTSALDALRYQKFDEWHDWSIEGCAYVFEKMNGLGYRLYHPNVKSPYLWSFSTIYTSGKYVADGRFDPNAVSEQCGAMTMLKSLGGV